VKPHDNEYSMPDRIQTRMPYLYARNWATLALLPAVIAAFLVSGLMHEVIFYYFTCAYPTWEVTWFFVLQGVCVAIEIVVKKAVTDRWQLNRAISRPLTVGFVVVTGVWLFFPQIIKNGVHEKDIKE
jgi:H+/Cl- antiporter ClcA